MFRLFLFLCVMIGANVQAIPLCVMIGANVQAIPLSVCDDRS